MSEASPIMKLQSAYHNLEFLSDLSWSLNQILSLVTHHAQGLVIINELKVTTLKLLKKAERLHLKTKKYIFC